MNHDLKPYPEYKDSDLPWLGEVPEHWGMERAKWLFRKMDRPVRETDEVVTCFRDGAVTLRKKRRVRGFTESIKEIGYQGIRQGDLVIHAMDAFAGAVGVSDSDGKGTPVYSVCEPTPGVSAHYYAYTVREMARSLWILALAKGIRERSTDFRFDDFASQPVPLPPLPEQSAIVRFLDYMEWRIRRYIRAKQKLIALLNEQKQAIIHRAVTRGLDPNVRLKPSGIDWIQDVPEHWEMRKVKHVAQLLVSNVDKISLTDETPIRLCNYNDVYKNEVISEEIGFMVGSATKDEITKFRLRNGDVIITKDSEMWNDIGVPALVAYEAPDLVCGYHLAILRPDAQQMQSEFLLRCFQDPLLVTQLHIQANGITRYGLSQHAIKNCLVPVPSVKEQVYICAMLQRDLAGINAAEVRASREIDLLREYRTGLIADVVTGKLDVRGLEMPTLDEGEAVEDLEIGEDTKTDEMTDSDEAADGDDQ